MDIETLKLILPVAGALIGAFGAAAIAGLVAIRVARENQRGQRHIERDKAVRAWRERRALELTDFARKRLAMCVQLTMMRGIGDVAGAEKVRGELAVGAMEHEFWVHLYGSNIET